MVLGSFFFFFFFRFPFVYSVVMASEVTQAHVAAKQSQPSLGLTGKAVRAASPRPGLANGPAARWGSRFPALQAAHAYCSGSPSPLGVRDCWSPRGNAAQQVGRSARRSPTWGCRHSARVEGRAERWFCLAWTGPGAETLWPQGVVPWRGLKRQGPCVGM